MEQATIFDLLDKAQARMVPTTVAQGLGPAQPMSVAGAYTANVLGKEGNANEARTFVPYRTLPPQTDYVYGVDKQPLAKTDNSRFESKPISGPPNQLPIYRGWRPNRPEMSYSDLGMQLFTPQQGPGIESTIPQEREMVNRAGQMATAPFPTLPESMSITPEMQNNKGIYLEGPDAEQETSMSGMGDDITDTISSLAKSIASTIQTKYGVTPIPKPAFAPSNIPWGTLLTVGVLGAAAVYFIPKMTR